MILSNIGIISSSGVVVIPPINVVAPTISGTNAVGNMLTATNGTWTGTSISYTYQWKRNGVNISSATSITYTLVQADAGFNITCQVTGTNIAGTSSALSNSLLCYDANAYAYNTAIGLTATTQTIAINELVLNLKAANIYNKFNALYPMITDKVTQLDIATQMKYNLINPTDSNAAFRLAWAGGWLYSSNGAKPNGSSAYANTFLTPSSNLSLNSTHLSYYATTGGVPASYGITMGSVVNLGDYAFTYIGTASDSYFYPLISSGTTGGTNLFYVPSRYNSLMIGNRNSSSSQIGWANNTKTSLPRVSYALNGSSIYIGARNFAGTIDNYGTNECRFSSIGQGLTDLECQVFYAIVENYQVALGRSVNPTLSFYYDRNYNNETNAYLFSTQITNSTIQGALNTLVIDLKNYGIWTKIKGAYPMVTDKVIQADIANQMKFNLVNPQDTNAAFRLNWVGGWSYSSNGAKPNGSNAYADTSFVASGNATLFNTHQSFYSRTSAFVNAGVSQAGFFWGVSANTGYWTGLDYWGLPINNNTKQISAIQNSSAAASDYAASPVLVTKLGFWMNNRTSATPTTLKVWRDGVAIANATTSSAGQSLTTRTLTLSCLNNGTNFPAYVQWFDDSECAYASFGDGLTDIEAQNYRLAIQTFNTTLGRQV